MPGQVILAEHAGFCWGVRKAIEKAKEVRQKYPLSMDVCTYGPLVHNKEVVESLKVMRISTVEHNLESFMDLKKGTVVIISAHGVGPVVYQKAEDLELVVEDTTCAGVKMVHERVKKISESGRLPIIVGRPDHSEVRGIVGYSKEAIVIRNPDKIPPYTRSMISKYEGAADMVAQTTEREGNVSAVYDKLKKEYRLHGRLYSTICKATRERQTAALDLAKKVDVMVVIGDKSSNNTKELGNVCRSVNGVETYLVETEADLRFSWFKNEMSVGVTAGASTPDDTIQRVIGVIGYMQSVGRIVKVVKPLDYLPKRLSLLPYSLMT